MATIVNNSNYQFRGIADQVWAVELTANDFASAANGAQTAAATITVPGVVLGDMVVGISCSTDQLLANLFAYVQAANTVKLIAQNTSGGAVDLASSTFKILIIRPAANVFP